MLLKRADKLQKKKKEKSAKKKYPHTADDAIVCPYHVCAKIYVCK